MSSTADLVMTDSPTPSSSMLTVIFGLAATGAVSYCCVEMESVLSDRLMPL